MRRGNGGPTERCTNRCVTGKKKSFKAQAKKEAKFLKYNKKYTDTVPCAYKCKVCGWWHVGNTI